MDKLYPLALLLVSLLSGACSTVNIGEPGIDAQTILILPVQASNTSSQKYYGFYYVYDLVNLDQRDISARLEIRLPVSDGYVMVDFLPPGRYQLERFSFLPVGRGTRTYDNNVIRRYDRFELESGKITIFDRSLNVSKFDDSSSVADSSSITNMDLARVSTAQLIELIEGLNRQANIGLWQLDDFDLTVIKTLQGKWVGTGDTDVELSTTGKRCDLELVSIDIDGSLVSGKDGSAEPAFEIKGTLGLQATIKAEVTDRGKSRGRIWGRFDDDTFRGTYSDGAGCRGVLTLRRPPSSSTQLTATELDGESPPGAAILADEAQAAALQPAGGENPNPGPSQDKPTASSTGAGSEAAATAPVPVQPAANEDDDALEPARLMGRFKSDITSASIYIFKRQYRDIEVTLLRRGKKIEGYDDSGNLRIGGTIEKDTIRYWLEPTVVSGYYNVEGEWKMNHDGSRLRGFWIDSRGDGPGQWNLDKIR